MINGRGGSIDYKDVSWQGFEAQDLIATIDLGEILDINSVEVRFLQSQAFWIFLPKHIEIEHSIDGANYDIIYEESPNNEFSFDQKVVSYKVDFLMVFGVFLFVSLVSTASTAGIIRKVKMLQSLKHLQYYSRLPYP